MITTLLTLLLSYKSAEFYTGLKDKDSKKETGKRGKVYTSRKICFLIQNNLRLLHSLFRSYLGRFKIKNKKIQSGRAEENMIILAWRTAASHINYAK